MSGRLSQIASSVLASIDLDKVGTRKIGRLVAHEGNMLEAEGFNHPLGTAVRIVQAGNTVLRGEVVGFHGTRTLILPFDCDAPVAAGSRVEPDGHGGLADCGDALLGRVIDAHGKPLDGKGAIRAQAKWPLAGVRTNPLRRSRVTEPLDVGVRAVNALLTVGVGQRVAIIAGSGVGKSVLMGQLLAGVEADVVVTGLIGERSREVSDFVETKIKGELRDRSVVVAVPADHPPLLRLRAAMRATAIAEYFRAQGKRVFLLIDSLTRVAHAQREIGLGLGEPPTMKGYPPSALSIIPRLVERAGSDSETGGSITAVYTVLADGGDTDDPVVDAARAIVDGHIILSRSLSEQSVFPAIDVGKSLSRTMPEVVDDDHLRGSARFRHLWSIYEENRDLLLMGAYVPGSDPSLDLAIAHRQDMLDFLRQSPREVVNLAEARNDLVGAFSS